jgi:energy-coupling factor transporter ATP-binding protein EcfA2
MPYPALNPFVWSDAVLADDAVSRQPFTERIALNMKSGTHVALFGPRGTGKSSFLLQLSQEVAREHGPDAPPWSMITIDLRTAISLPAFVAAVSKALREHPDKRLRRRGIDALRDVEKELGVNLGLVKAGVKSSGKRETNDGVILEAQLAQIAKLSERIVIAFDEFQRLNSCPGEPLSHIRTALMGPANAGHVSLLLTGSLREKLQLMLKTDTEPIWDQALERELPDLDGPAFIDYLQFRFDSSGKPIEDTAIEHLVELGGHHPKRTQQIAWHTWDQALPDEEIEVDAVNAAYENLIESEDKVAGAVDQLLSGDESEVNEAKALFLIGAGASPGSRLDAHRYGLANESTTARALKRSKARGLVREVGGNWRITDPLLAEWLRRNDPLGLQP